MAPALRSVDLASRPNAPSARGLRSFLFQLRLSSSVQRTTQINSRMCPGVAQVEL